jgi:hypothetical protein
MSDTAQLVSTGITAAASLLGVAVGASLQYLYGRSGEAKRHERELRLNAYSDYLRSVGEMETLSTGGDAAQRSDIIGRAIAAKARVCVNGSAAVVKALSRFEGESGQGLTPEKRRSLLAFIVTVRTEMGATGEVTEADIDAILFGSGTV